MASCNWILVETEQAKELSVAEAIDRLTGGNWSYLPMEYRTKAITRFAQGKRRTIAVPILPRIVFMSASYPHLEHVTAIRGVEGIMRNPWGLPEVIPGWEMNQFMAKVDESRSRALKMAAKANLKPRRAPKFDSFAALKAWFDKNSGLEEEIDPETGEILDVRAA